jgi:acyl transferase domain-containing protein/surfactin synthase thioesterase subunit/acyl carrier protein
MSSLRRNSDIAIIGMSCRVPGAGTTEEYWKNMCDGVESVAFFSDQELLQAGVDPSLIAKPNYVKAAPILRDVEMFDAAFFGYSPKDAALMDPQQRLFLEVCWEAFEDAGYDPAGYPGKVGVLSAGGGVVTSYLLAKLHHPDLPGQTASISHINNDKDFLSTRVAFKLDLTGPSFTIQSACSSSLLAVHQACLNLRCHECDMMLVGGSVVRVPQIAGYLAEKRNLHSLDGHCRPFDVVGQGTIFGSGVGAVLLKPLDQAIADRDHIYAVIRGTAANNDGSAKSSFTAPSLDQQAQAVVDSLNAAGISADSLGYLECHSTGTVVGDPLEIEALTMAFRKASERRQYCAIGSVKANIGHPEQAAGIAGLIKTALVLHHKQIPPSINYDTPNPAIDFASSPFFVNTKLRDFPSGDTPRRAGLNSLGIGGTNTFAVLEEAPPVSPAEVQSDSRPCLVTLSAKSAKALVARVEQLLNWVKENPEAPIGDVCYTTNVSRSQFAFRFAAPARSLAELTTHLEGWLATSAKDVSRLQRTRNAPIAFMFSGQGAQHAGMTAELYRTHSVFRNVMDSCHALAQSYLEKGLLEVVFASGGEDALVNRTDYTQPALFAVEYALASLVKSWGISPEAMIGHSLGEIAAACVADVMTLEEAMRLVNARGALMHRLPSGGAMVSIMAEESMVRSLIDKVGSDVAVAAMNGPLNTVVSGDRDALRVLSEELEQRAITYRELRISNGFHSPRTEPILDELESIAGQIDHRPPKVPLISNLTGEVISAAPDKSYWRRHLRESVRFGDGMRALANLECGTFLEIGPHPVLLPLGQMCLAAKGKTVTWVATLNRQKSDADALTEMLVALYLAGHEINWAEVHADSSWRRLPLPTYPFERRRHWIEDDPIHTERTPQAVDHPHPLVGTRFNSTTKEMGYQAHYGVQHARYLSDHRVAGSVVLPTTAELEAAMIVGRMHFGEPRVSFENAIHHQAMSFAEGENRVVRVLITPLKSDRAGFRLVSAAREDAEDWQTHLTGTLRKAREPSWPIFSPEQVQARCRQTLSVGDFYEWLGELGLEYGPAFRGVREIYLGPREALTKVRLPGGLASPPHVMHPAFLDACLHGYPLVLNGANPEYAGRNGRRIFLPVSVEGFCCYRDGIDEAWAHIRLRSVEIDGTQVVDIRIYDVASRPLAELEGLAVRALPLDILKLPSIVKRPSDSAEDLLHRVAWRKSVSARDSSDERRAPGSWLIFADRKDVGLALACRLELKGHHCHLVYRDDAFGRRGPRTWIVNERQAADFRQLLEQFAASEELRCDGVVYVWGLDTPPLEGLTLASLKSSNEMICRGALALLHALADTRSTHPTGRRLWFITADTQRTGGADQQVDPVQTPLWGLGRTIAIEYPGIWGGLIDLQLSADREPDIDLLVAELLHPDGETQIAISAPGERYVARFVKQPFAELPAQVPKVSGDATYLVTGGLGMLGRSVAEWLINRGAKHLVLTGRNASLEAAQGLFSAAEMKGASIHVMAADVSRDEDVRRLISTISNGLPPLRGVVHSAGVLDDGILAQLDWDRFARLFEPRIYGSWLLHEHTKSVELDFFILQSSLLSLLGSAGQGNYTASAAFLDGLAAHRRASGLPATAINWCAWSGGGLATVSGARGEAMWTSLGLQFVSPDLAIQVFDKIMQRDVDQVAVASADWPAYARKVGRSPFLAELLNESSGFGPPALTPATDPARPVPMPTDDQQRRRLLSRLQQHITAELGFAELIDPHQTLNDLGVDSLMSVTLSNSLEKEFGIPVSVAELIKGPTLNELVDGIFCELLESSCTEPDHDGSAAPAATPIASIRARAIGVPATGDSDSPRERRVEVGSAPGETLGSSSVVSIAVRPSAAAFKDVMIPGGERAQANGGQRTRIQAILQQHLMAELGFADPIDPDQPLNDIGLDSLRSVALSNTLEDEFGMPISVAELIKGPTINQLVEYLLDEFAGALRDDSVENASTMAGAAVTTLAAGPRNAAIDVEGRTAFEEGATARPVATGMRIAAERNQLGLHAEQAARSYASSGPAAGNGLNGNVGFAARAESERASSGNGAHREEFLARRSSQGTNAPATTTGKWLIAPRPNPDARARLFCFPYAGGGLVSFRAWPQVLDDWIEVVAVEPPGRGTRINEVAINDMDAFVECLLPELIQWLDRPSAFFGHCLGGLTMFAMLCALPEAWAQFIKHVFACGVRPPHLLKRKGRFEDNLLYDMLLHQDFDIRRPAYAQTDEIFVDIVRHFDTPAADRMLGIPKLREALLPTIRAEFGMAYNFNYRPIEPFSFPISSFVGDLDPWVSGRDSAGWGELTRSRFTNHVRRGSHFLLVDDRSYILDTIRNEIGGAAKRP